MGNPAGVRRDFDALEKCRFQAIRLLDDGLNQIDIAHRLNCVPLDAVRWVGQYRHQGREALRKAGRAGRKPRLDAVPSKRLEERLRQRPERLGYETPLWSCPRMADLIEREFRIRYHPYAQLLKTLFLAQLSQFG